MKYKGIISDPDGVICSADEDHYPALKTPADRLNISFGGEGITSCAESAVQPA